MYIISNLGEETYYYVIRLYFKMPNNEAEYEALLKGLAIAKVLGAMEVEVREDCQVVVKQVKGEYMVKGEALKVYLQQLC